MNEAAYQAILTVIEPVISELGLTQSGEPGAELFAGAEKSVKVVYQEEKKLFELHIIEAAGEDAEPEIRVAASWLFDEAHSVRDAKAIGADFADTLRSEFGIKREKTKREVSLPEKGAPGSTADASALAQRFLTIFPAYKETYKEHVEKNGEFLYEEFFREYAAPKLRELLDARSKKQLEKYLTMLEEVYISGNVEVGGLITLTIIAGAVGMDDQRWEVLTEYLADKQYLKPASHAMIRYARSKKLVG